MSATIIRTQLRRIEYNADVVCWSCNQRPSNSAADYHWMVNPLHPQPEYINGQQYIMTVYICHTDECVGRLKRHFARSCAINHSDDQKNLYDLSDLYTEIVSDTTRPFCYNYFHNLDEYKFDLKCSKAAPCDWTASDCLHPSHTNCIYCGHHGKVGQSIGGGNSFSNDLPFCCAMCLPEPSALREMYPAMIHQAIQCGVITIEDNDLLAATPAPSIRDILSTPLPTPIVNQLPTSIINQSLTPIMNQSFAPINNSNELSTPVVNQSPTPVINQSPVFEYEELPSPLPSDNEEEDEKKNDDEFIPSTPMMITHPLPFISHNSYLDQTVESNEVEFIDQPWQDPLSQILEYDYTYYTNNQSIDG